jgi:hypothetical protein
MSSSIDKLKREKPWVRLRITKAQYLQTRPWQSVGSRARFEDILDLLPEEAISAIWDEAHGNMLAEAIFGGTEPAE